MDRFCQHLAYVIYKPCSENDLKLVACNEYQSKLTLMSESLRNDGRIWVPKKLEDVKALR